MEEQFWNKFDELSESTCYIIDFLPNQVPKKSDGQFFKIEEYFLMPPQIDKIYEKFTNILLKLNCYYNFTVHFASDDRIYDSPSPDKLTANIINCFNSKDDSYINIIIEAQNTLITLSSDSLYLAIYNPNKAIIDLMNALASSEGLFFRKV